MSFHDGIAQHRADSAEVEQRRVFAHSVVDAGSLPALQRANRRLRRRRLGYDMLLGVLTAVAVTLLLWIGLAMAI